MRYNGRAPYVIGEEWVPIRQASFLPSQEEERGYTFTIDHAATIVTGTFYVDDQPTTTVANQIELIAVYPGDTEDLSGPLMQVVIPASAISVTGNVVGLVTDLLNPSDAEAVLMNADDAAPIASMAIQFDVSAYQNALQGKRIVDVKLLYTVRSFNVHNSLETQISIARAANGANFIPYDIIGQFDAARFLETDFDSVNVFWNSGVNAISEPRAYPWRWEELNLFDETAIAGTKLAVVMDVFADASNPNSSTNRVDIGYAALQVTFCEERRILYGGKRIHGFAALPNEYELGPNLVQLRTTAFALPGSTAAGGYFVSHSHRQIAESRFSQNRQPPLLYALRQLYEIPTMQSRIVDIDKNIGEEFTSERTDIVPYLTLHHTGAIVTGSHAYGQQVAAPVYGAITAVQSVNGILADGASNGPFTQVRFYARRFGSSSGTLVLREGVTARASITEAEFDALPQIVDGWREVTLAIPVPFSFTGTDVAYTWEALGVNASSRWEILGADGPSLTSTHASGLASYEPQQGVDLELTWKAPNQTSSTEDDNADAVLIFSQDPPAVTGFTVIGSGCTIAVTGIGADCNLSDACLPTAIHGNALSWTSGAVCDTYSREVIGEWGRADTGQITTTSGGAAANYLVTDGKGVFAFTANNTATNVLYPASIADPVLRGEFQISAQPTGSNVEVSLQCRRVDGSNFIQARIFLLETGIVTCNARYVIAAVETVSPTVIIPNLTATGQLKFTLEVIGTTIRLRVWPADQPEPIGIWHLVFATTLTSAGSVVVDTFVSGAVTGPFPFQVMFDNFTAMHAALDGATVEVQRSDDLTGWQTIATVSPCVTGICDLEARVGLESRYRIRTCNALDFCGPWVTGAGTLAAPGIDGAGNGDGVLIFTSNQAPASSLAYVMAFERDTTREFAFPEAGFTSLDTHFQRDYFVAFRPLERGGEQFSETLLVNAIAITPQSLANMTDLRDLAWADLPYICVRDELGNRWLANVQVPNGRVQRRNTLYYARIDVTQVTDIAAPVEEG